MKHMHGRGIGTRYMTKQPRKAVEHMKKNGKNLCYRDYYVEVVVAILYVHLVIHCHLCILMISISVCVRE